MDEVPRHLRRPHREPRGCSTIFWVPFLVLGLAFIILFGRASIHNIRTIGWDSVRCDILEVAPDNKDSGNLNVRFKYLAKGRERESTTYTLGVRDESDTPLTNIHRVGQPGHCFVNPRNPDEAVLYRGSVPSALMIFVPVIFFVIGVTGLWNTWRREDARFSTANLVWMLTGIIFFIVGALVFYLVTLYPAYRLVRTLAWQKVSCQISRSEVGAILTRAGRERYFADITYGYGFGGQQFQSTLLTFSQRSLAQQKSAEAIVARHPPASMAACYVDPKNPGEAVLYRTPNWRMFLGTLAIAPIFLGAWLARFQLIRGPSFTERLTATVSRVDTKEHDSRGSRKLVAFLELAWAALWSTIAFFVVRAAIADWPVHGKFTSLTAAAVAFSVFALLTIAKAIRVALGFLSPRFYVTFPDQVCPGDNLQIEWRLTGRSNRVETLRITLEGSEEADSTGGSDNRNDRCVFTEISVTSTSDPARIANGTGSLSIPRRTMHTFYAKHNRITWTLFVRAKVRGLPDIEDDFSIHVLPAANSHEP